MRCIKFLVVATILIVGCKKDPAPPGAVTLVAPAKNAECNPIESLSGNQSSVLFSWQAGSNSTSYELQVTNLSTNDTQTAVTSGLSEIVQLNNGTAFSWSVISKNNEVTQTATSETWFFYNPGSETTFAPFPAEILNPLPGTQVFKDANDEVQLEWQGTDLDDDIDAYEVYFGTNDPPTDLITPISFIRTTQNVAVTSNTTYYWRIVTRDSEGNTSDTKVVSFRAL